MIWGLCFAYLHTNDGIYLIDNDFIEFKISYETQLKFLMNAFFEFDLKKLEILLELSQYNREDFSLKPIDINLNLNK